MIVFNNQITITDEDGLESFCTILKNEVFDEGSRICIEELVDYLHECFKADIRLMQMTKERIGSDIIPITFIEFTSTSNLNEVKFSIMSEDENREMSVREELIFREICDICFGSIRGMFDRVCSRVES